MIVIVYSTWLAVFRTDLSFDLFTQEFWTVTKQQNWPYFILTTKTLNPILIKTCMRGILKVMLNLSSLISRFNLFYNRHWVGEDKLTQFTNSTRRLTCSFILNSVSVCRLLALLSGMRYRQEFASANVGESIVVDLLTFRKRFHTYFQVEYW